MSIIQEALKKAQDNYTGKKNPHHVQDDRQQSAPRVPKAAADDIPARKSPALAVYAAVLIALLAGFGMKGMFSKNTKTDKESAPRDPVEISQKAAPVKAASASSVSNEVVERAAGSFASLAPFGQINRPPNLTLNGIMYVEDNPRAIINGTVVTEGDVISGATVTSIKEGQVLLKYNNNDNKVEMALRIKD